MKNITFKLMSLCTVALLAACGGGGGGGTAPSAHATDTASIVMLKVTGGTFTMGDTFGDGFSSELPTHQVTLSDYYVSKYEVTQGQWLAIMGNNPSYFSACGADCPVENVSWNEVQAFITKINQQNGTHYRLPTEAEWEYAARSGGQSQKYSGGNDVNAVAWTSNDPNEKPHPVGLKQANGLGLHDMSGNVWEWVNDIYGQYSSSTQTNPTGPPVNILVDDIRVIRGGAVGPAIYARTSARLDDLAYSKGSGIGFRLASTLP